MGDLDNLDSFDDINNLDESGSLDESGGDNSDSDAIDKGTDLIEHFEEEAEELSNNKEQMAVSLLNSQADFFDAQNAASKLERKIAYNDTPENQKRAENAKNVLHKYFPDYVGDEFFPPSFSQTVIRINEDFWREARVDPEDTNQAYQDLLAKPKSKLRKLSKRLQTIIDCTRGIERAYR